MKAAVPHNQHPAAQTAQQAQATLAFAGMVGPAARIDDDMRATLGQQDPLHLRKSARTARTGMAPKVRRRMRRIGHVFHDAIQCHQTQAEHKRTAGALCGNRVADRVKQRDQRPRPQLAAAIADRAGARQADSWVWPDEAQSARQFGQHRANRQAGVQMQRDHQPDHDRHGQLAFAVFARSFLCQDVRNSRVWDGATQRLDSQGAAERAFGVDLSYSESHGVTPGLAFGGCTRKYAIEVAPIRI